MVRQILINNAALAFQYFASGLGALIINPYIVKSVGINQFGFIAIAISAATIISIIINYGAFLTGPRDISLSSSRGQRATIFKEVTQVKLIVFIGVALVSLVIYLFTAEIFDYQVRVEQIIILGGFIISAVLNSTWVLQGLNKFSGISLLSVAITGLTIAACLNFLQEGSNQGVIGSFIYVMGPLMLGIATLLLAKHYLDVRWMDLCQISAAFKVRLKEGFPLVSSQLISASYTAAGPMIIAGMLGTTAAGTFAAMDRIVSPVLGALTLIHTASFPVLSRLFGRSAKQYWRMALGIVFIYELMAVVLSVVCLNFDEQILIYIVGDISDEIKEIYYFALVWIHLGIFGPLLTGYWSLTKAEGKILKLNVQVCIITAMLTPGLMHVFGVQGWYMGICVAQAPLMYAIWKTWAKEPKKI